MHIFLIIMVFFVPIFISQVYAQSLYVDVRVGDMDKIEESKYIASGVSVLRNSDNTQFLKDSGDNIDYQQFLEDAKTIGITTCVEGPTVGVTTAYNVARQAEYPSIVDQLDKIYHGGVDAWKADIKAIKDKYPKTQVGVTTVAAVPSWVQTEVDKLNS